MKKKVLALLLSTAMVLSVSACGDNNTQQSSDQPSSSTPSSEQPSKSETPSKESEPPAPAEPTVIRFGTHWVRDLDPNWTDDVTGEHAMDEAKRQAALAALEAVKNELNVEIEFLQFPNDVQSDLMTSVLAGDPICDLALMWNGCQANILAQNVLQKLDDYVDLFNTEENSWLLADPLFDHYYLLGYEKSYVPSFPFAVNLTLLNAVPALQGKDGPMELYLKGEWTWSKFEEILKEVKAYYDNVPAPADAKHYKTVQAYETDFRYAALAAMYANGGGIYRDGTIAADSDESIEAVAFIDKLKKANLLTNCGLYDDGFVPRWCEGGDDFRVGATVFSDIPSWYVNGCAAACSERGESIAILPWPRADRLAAEDCKTPFDGHGNSVGVLKGSKVDTELILKTYILYWNTYCNTLDGTDRDATLKEKAKDFGIDIFNEEFGDNAFECFKALVDSQTQNLAGLLGIWENKDDAWTNVLGKSLEGLEPSYDVNIKAHLDGMNNLIAGIASNLASDTVHDNQKPKITKETVAVPVGTKYEDIKWTDYFTAEDGLDGVLDPASATFEDMTGGKFQENLDKVGIYEGDSSVKIHIKDSSGNEETSRFKVVVYNPDNTAAPVITPKADLPTVKVDTDASSINWKDYIDSAVDADGLDVKDSVTADLSELDTTTAGTYNVVLTVTDYVGNTGSETLEVTVAAE